MTEKGHNENGGVFYRNTKQGEHYWKREKTLESMYVIQKKLDVSLDYVDKHFDTLVKLIDSREQYNKLFKDKIYWNKTDNQFWVFHYITQYNDELIVQTETYGKYRGRDDSSETPNVTLQEALILIDSGRLVKMDISYNTFENEWDRLTSDYYEKRKAYEIKIHDELIDKLFNTYKKEIKKCQ